MKGLITTLLLIVPAIGAAQNYQNMSDTDTQKMMQQMQQAQACMAGVDQAGLKKFEQRANQMQSSVKALCASGKRDEAQQEAIAFGREVTADPSMQKMQECSKMMAGMPGMPAIPRGAAGEDDNRHICDQ
jgi:predicted lipoprotein